MRSRGHTKHSWFRAGSRILWLMLQAREQKQNPNSGHVHTGKMIKKKEKKKNSKKNRGRSTPVGSWPAAFLHTQHFGGRNRTSVSPCEPLILAQEFG